MQGRVIEPISIEEDRYAGAYVRLHLDRDGRFTAWHCAASDVPTAPSGDDTTASAFWAWVRAAGYIVGVGRSGNEAVEDLARQIERTPGYDKANQPRYLADWQP